MKSRAVLPTVTLMLAVLLIAASITFDRDEARRDHGFSLSADLEKEAIAYDQPAEANEVIWTAAASLRDAAFPFAILRTANRKRRREDLPPQSK